MSSMHSHLGCHCQSPEMWQWGLLWVGCVMPGTNHQRGGCIYIADVLHSPTKQVVLAP